MKCPICQGSEFQDFNGRQAVKCTTCGSLERHRAVRMILGRVVQPSPGMKMLHFSPERPLSPWLYEVIGEGYECFDLDPSGYQGLPVEVKKFDLCSDISALESNTYDLIMHNHVLEHLPCNYTIVLQNLQRALKPGGFHVFCMPISKGHYREDLDPALTKQERKERYLQGDHVRWFGREDIDQTIGMIFPEAKGNSLLRHFREDELRDANIRPHWWTLSGAAPFVIQKS